MQRALVLNWPLAAAQQRTSVISQTFGAFARPLGTFRTRQAPMRSLSTNEGVETQFYLHGLECLSPGAEGHPPIIRGIFLLCRIVLD